MRRRSLFLLVGIPVLAIIAGVSLAHNRENRSSKSNVSVPPTCQHDRELRTSQQWLQTVTFPYIGPEAKLQRVKENYSRVEVGSSKQEVLDAFGSPDFEEESAPKELNRPCLGYEFRYYFAKPEEATNEIKDKNIEVFFTNEGKVSWVVGNVGLAEKGGFAHRP
jgi:hypothetical protein